MRNCIHPAPRRVFALLGVLMIATLITRTREAASYVAGILTTIIGGLSLDDIAVIVGIGCTIGTFAVNWYYKRQENKREQERHNLEMNKL